MLSQQDISLLYFFTIHLNFLKNKDVRMPRITAFIIQKGGCGKTTTTANTASYLAQQGFRVLAVDMDPQGNLTQHLGYDTDSLEKTLLNIFLEQASFSEVVLHRSQNLDVLPNNILMAGHELTFYKSIRREFLLRDVLHPVQEQYDFILIDCPPNLGIFSLNALVAATEFVLVVAPEFFPMKAIKPFYETYIMVKKKLNHTLQFRGVLMTMCDFRTRHSQQVRAILQRNFPNKLYRSFIRNNVALKEAASVGKSIFEYAPLSPGAFDYQNFVEEFIRDHHDVQKKRRYYDSVFKKLSEEEKAQILQAARHNLSAYNQHRLDVHPENTVLQEALIIERNKILEKLFPYRKQPVVDS